MNFKKLKERKKRCKQANEEKEKMFDILVSKRIEKNRKWMLHQEKIQNKASEELNKMLQQNSLLLIQAFAMATQIQSHVPSSSNFPPNVGFPYMFQPVCTPMSNTYCFPNQFPTFMNSTPFPLYLPNINFFPESIIPQNVINQPTGSEM